MSRRKKLILPELSKNLEMERPPTPSPSPIPQPLEEDREPLCPLRPSIPPRYETLILAIGMTGLMVISVLVVQILIVRLGVILVE